MEGKGTKKNSKAKINKADKLKEENASCRILKLISRVENLRTTDVANTGGNIVAFVGLTKSGKSTLINGLMGTPLKCVKDPDTEDTHIVHGAGGNGPKIGVGGESETEDPHKYDNLPGTNLALWDFPGFGDNKGTDQEILNAISYQKILRAQESIRFVVVASYTLIKGDNPLPFFELLYQLLHICPNIAQSLCIVGSKGEKGSLKALLQKAATQQFPHAEEGRKKVILGSQQLLTKVIQNGTFVDFKAPKMDDDDVFEAPFVLPNKQQIIDCINKLQGAKMGEIPLVISHEAKLDITGYYEACYAVIKRRVDELCSILTNFMNSKGVNVTEGSPAVKLEIHKSGKAIVEGVLKVSTDFETFFDAIENVGLGISNEFPDYIERFCFIEELQSLYKISDKPLRGEEEFFNLVKLCLNNGVAQYSSLIKHSEACTEEEKRKEEEWAKNKEKEISALQELLKELAKSNQETMAAAAEAREGAFTTIGKGIDKGIHLAVDGTAKLARTAIATAKECTVM